MILRTLGCYDDFVCIGGACKSSCCIGWELDIDEATCDYYRSLPGPFGDRLRAHMAAGSFREEDCHTFCLTIDGRCPLLNKEGLCDIVLTLGPEALCEICSEYPRYTFELCGAVEKSLTISCEEAARLMFTRTRPLLIEESTLDGAEDMSATEKSPLSDGENEDIAPEITLLRSRIITILQDRRLPLKARVARAVRLTDRAQALINRAGLLACPLMEALGELLDEEEKEGTEAERRVAPERPAAFPGAAAVRQEYDEDDSIRPMAQPEREGALKALEVLNEEKTDEGALKAPEALNEGKTDKDALETLKSPLAALKARMDLLEGCEVLSDEWTEACGRVRRAFSEEEPVWEHYMADLFYPRQVDYEHLLVYFVFRYFPRAAYDFDAFGKLAFAVFMTMVIRDLDWAAWRENGGRLGISDRIKSAGIVSRQVEHSDYNLDTLFEDIAFDERFRGEALLAQL